MGGPGGFPGGRGGPGGFGPSPLVSALDKNNDGQVSAAEIKQSIQSLKAIDKNKDGKLVGDEIHPPGAGGPPPE